MSDHNGVKKDIWNKRDSENINAIFGTVTNFHSPSDYIRFMEIGTTDKIRFVDYQTESFKQPTKWNTNFALVYTADTCEVYHSGKVKWTGEKKYLKRLYHDLNIESTVYPEHHKDNYQSSYMWLSDRHRQFNHKCYAIDVDAWSTTSDGRPIIWDLKYEHGKYGWIEEKAFKILDEVNNWPVFKVVYSRDNGSWINGKGSDKVTITPVTRAARTLLSDTKEFTDFESARECMNRIVADHEYF